MPLRNNLIGICSALNEQINARILFDDAPKMFTYRPANVGKCCILLVIWQHVIFKLTTLRNYCCQLAIEIVEQYYALFTLQFKLPRHLTRMMTCVINKIATPWVRVAFAHIFFLLTTSLVAFFLLFLRWVNNCIECFK